jgi:hypothetical protein
MCSTNIAVPWRSTAPFPGSPARTSIDPFCAIEKDASKRLSCAFMRFWVLPGVRNPLHVSAATHRNEQVMETAGGVIDGWEQESRGKGD